MNWKHFHGGPIAKPYLDLFTSGPVSDEEFRFLVNNSSENVERHEQSHYDPQRKCLNSIHYKDKYVDRDLKKVDDDFLLGERVNFKLFLARVAKYPMSRETFERLINSENTTDDYDKSKQHSITNSNNIRKLANVLHQQEIYQTAIRATHLYSVEKLNYDLEQDITKSKNGHPEERKARLEGAAKLPEKIQIVSIGYRRNPDVITEVLVRANGVCERCKNKAPFTRKKDKTPYLEVHHKEMLSIGGEDTIENAIALCPNCHREQHFGL